MEKNISSTKECGTTTSIGTITKPDCSAPCEPGTSVYLEGIVWQETDGGILVVNVTWRGKTYVGALLDCTKHDWAPPYICNSPSSDIDTRTYKSVKSKRSVTRNNGLGVDEKNLLQTTGKLRNGKGRRLLNDTEYLGGSSIKKQRESNQSNESTNETTPKTATPTTTTIAENNDKQTAPVTYDAPATTNLNGDNVEEHPEATESNASLLISCTEPDCSKKYRSMNGLQYHRKIAHGNNNNNNNNNNSNNNNNNNTSTSNNSNNNDSSKIVHNANKSHSPIGTNEEISDQIKDGMPKRDDLLTREQPSTNDRSDRHPTLDQMNPTSSNKTNHSTNNRPILNTSKPIASSRANSMPTLLPKPMSMDEGMKPSGISTGPPPAPHAADYYFNSLYNNQLAAAYNFNHLPGMDIRMKPPPAPTSNLLTDPAAFFSNFMNLSALAGAPGLGPQPPPPPPPSHPMSGQSDPPRMSSPSLPKNNMFPYLPPVIGPPGVPNQRPLMRHPSPPISMQMPMPPQPNSPSASRQPRFPNAPPGLPPFWPFHEKLG